MSYTFLKGNVFNLDLKRLTSEQARISKGACSIVGGQQRKTLAGHKIT